MQKYVTKALNIAEKSMASSHKHGAICIVGNRVVSFGYNYPTDPHCIRCCEKGRFG